MSDVTQDGKIAAQKGNDVSVLDELRAALADSATTQTPDGRMLYLTDALIALHHIAAAHPGLVEVVRCGECEHQEDGWCHRWKDICPHGGFYCWYGKRKETGA